MLRFALAADGSVVPDIRRNLPGRGVWTRLSFEAVRRAAAKGAFARAFRAKAEAPLSPCGDGGRASGARRAAVPVDGQQGRTCRRRRIQGRRGDRGGRRRGPDSGQRRRAGWGRQAGARRLRVKLGPAAGTIARINVFSSSQLGLALGKANVIHAALKSGAASSAFLARAERLRRYRASEADAATRTQSGGAPADSAATLGRPDELADRPSD